MSSSRPRWRGGRIGLALAAAVLALGGCTLTPVYGERGVGAARLEVAYSAPATRLDQIVIEDLALRLGKGGGPGAPQVAISTSAANRALTHSNTARPTKANEVTVSVAYTVTVAGKVVAVGNRAASAAWTTRGQVLADEEARREAEERAARAAAETVRLAILGALAGPRP
ncbi:hypothetical protein [Devosia sp.]|uniref:hypothetical protein n=1 Tax=Devosia sp. TaxID=1871048 RepID=UPI002EFFAAA8